MLLVVAVFVLAVLLTTVAWLIRELGLRVVGVAPRRKVIVARRIGKSIELPLSVLTTAPGHYGLWFGERFEHHALIGDIERSDGERVVRRLLDATAPVPSVPFEARLTGHVMHSPSEIATTWHDIAIPLRDGSAAPAWLFSAARPGRPWVIHVQGLRTSRLVTLRSVEVAERARLTSLVVTYRGAGDGPAAPVSYLGEQEWCDLADAVAFARSHGASAVYIVAWSMGAGIALELLRREPNAVERLVLVAPATNWWGIIRHGAERAGLPRLVAPIVRWALGSPIGSRVIGMSVPLDFDRLDWSRGFRLVVPTLVVHSPGDEEIPFALTEEFATAHPRVTLVRTAHAPHAWEANVDPEVFQSSLTAWFSPGAPSR